MKEFKTIAAQIDILKSRGMIVGEGASTVLLRENYYSIINGYKNPFLDKDAMRANANDLYLEGTRFEWLYSLCQFGRARTEVGNDRYFATNVARYFGCYVEVLRSFSHARHNCSILRLEVEHYVAVGTLAQHAKMETALHRRLHSVEHFAVGYTADRNLLLRKSGHPRACSRNERFVADAP